MKQRGVFEKVAGSGVWWVCYFDHFGKKRRGKRVRRALRSNCIASGNSKCWKARSCLNFSANPP